MIVARAHISEVGVTHASIGVPPKHGVNSSAKLGKAVLVDATGVNLGIAEPISLRLQAASLKLSGAIATALQVAHISSKALA